MNARIKIFSKANMLGQHLSLILVLLITVFLTLTVNNSFVLGHIIMKIPKVTSLLSGFSVKATRIIFFTFLGLASYIALVPFRYGSDVWFYENAKKTRLPLKQLFSFYSIKKSSSALNLVTLVELKKLLCTLIFLLPSLVITGYIFYALGEGVGTKMLLSLIAGDILLLLTGVFFSFVFSQRYFLAAYIMYENDNCKAGDAIKLSAQIMENKCFETAFFKLSFSGWFFLCLFIFPTLYVYPFYKMSNSLKAVSLLANTENNA